MATSGRAAFHKFYQSIYKERWIALSEALCSPVQHVALTNPFLPAHWMRSHMSQCVADIESPSYTDGTDTDTDTGNDTRYMSILADNLSRDSSLQVYKISASASTDTATDTDYDYDYDYDYERPNWPAPSAMDVGPADFASDMPSSQATSLYDYFLLDGASIVPVLALEPQSGERILDMCAAPGGKSLAIAFWVFGTEAKSKYGADYDDTDGDHHHYQRHQDEITDPMEALKIGKKNKSSDESNQSTEHEQDDDDEQEIQIFKDDRMIADADIVVHSGHASSSSSSSAAAASDTKTQINHDSDSDSDSDSSGDEEFEQSAINLQRRTIITCNDTSSKRAARLQRVLREYLPTDVQPNVQTSVKDASKNSWVRLHAASHDRVLLDAPCSSERHILHSAEEMAVWSRARTKAMYARQTALLHNAIQSAKIGGRIVYSTCSLSPMENDGVIHKILQKCGAVESKSGASDKSPYVCESIRVELPFGEPTRYGSMILPDVCGFGPIYVAVLTRVK
jgi:16S rRNA C967 or C1407 C5-methylase (RsmB/RsmF family)